MIKPEMLWNFIKTCTDTGKVGRVCRTLGRQSVPEASQDELLIAQMIDNDSNWLEERIEDKRRKDRERKRKRAAEAASQADQPHPPEPQIPAESSESVDSIGKRGIRPQPTNHPSIQPTNQPIVKKECVCVGTPHARGDVPTIEEVVAAATSMMGVDEEYARWWYAEMEARDWTNVRGGRIDRLNWRAVLKTWHNRADPNERAAARAARAANERRTRRFSAKDWELCADRCAHCEGGACSKGVAVPPVMEEWPRKPEECKFFTARN